MAEVKMPDREPIEATVVDESSTGLAVHRAKKSPLQRFKDIFLSTTPKEAWAVVKEDVIIPGVIALGVDLAHGYIDTLAYGERQSRSYKKHQTQSNKTAYYASYKKGSEDISRKPAIRSALGYSFDNIVFEDGEGTSSRHIALQIFEDLCDAAQEYPTVSVYDFLSIVEELTGNPEYAPKSTDQNWGWTSEGLTKADIVRVPGGWMIDLPKPQNIRDMPRK